MTISEILRRNPLVLAPMAGITDLSYRIICRELGAGMVFSEMISAEALIREQNRTMSMLRTDPAERPVAFQIFGSNPETMAGAARILSRLDIDFIDINMGCPVPKVIKSGAGSALLRDIGLVREILHAVVDSSSLPVTLKIRTGWDLNSINAEEIARTAEAAGISAITVHARTKTQLFSGKADWRVIARVKDSISIPVIGNGDICTAEDAHRMLTDTGCDGVMIGRACLGNPWIFREAKAYLKSGIVPAPPTLEERRAMMIRHLSDVVAIYGVDAGVRRMRKHLGWYSKGFRNGAEFRTKINSLMSVSEIMLEIDRFFTSRGSTCTQK